MRTVWAINDGNWSDPQIWSGGNVPDNECDVYSNGKVVTIDQDIDINFMTNSIYDNVESGGYFIVLDNIILKCNISSYKNEVLSFGGNGEITIIGSVSGCTYEGYVSTIKNENSGTINVSGFVFGGFSGYSHGINNLGTGTINVSGLVQGGSGGYSYGINNTLEGTINVEGDVRFGLGGYSYGINNDQNGTIIINGLSANHSGYYGKEPWEN